MQKPNLSLHEFSFFFVPVWLHFCCYFQNTIKHSAACYNSLCFITATPELCARAWVHEWCPAVWLSAGVSQRHRGEPSSAILFPVIKILSHVHLCHLHAGSGQRLLCIVLFSRHVRKFLSGRVLFFQAAFFLCILNDNALTVLLTVRVCIIHLCEKRIITFLLPYLFWLWIPRCHICRH